MTTRLARSSMWILLVCLALVQAGDGVAQDRKMYQWTDEDGTVHFSDTVPEGQAAQARDLPANEAPVGANPYQEAASEPSAAQRRREEIARNSQEAKVEQAARDAECAAWQAEVDRLEPSRRVYFTNEQGETERMDDVARTNRVAELKAQIAKNCR